MERKPYSAGAVKFSFWFQEFRKTVFMLADGISIEEIKKINQETNLFAASSPDRAKMIMNNVAKRIESLDASFIPVFINSDIVGQKLLCLVACMCTDTLFFDFTYSIIRGKLLLGLREYSDADVRAFWTQMQMQSDKVAGFTDATLNRLGKTYKLYLSSAGVTDNAVGTKQITQPIIVREIDAWLREHDLQPVIASLTGE